MQGKLLTMFALFRIKITLFSSSWRRLFLLFIPVIRLTILGSCYCKEIDVSFLYAVLLLVINFGITLSKSTVEPLACGSWDLEKVWVPIGFEPMSVREVTGLSPIGNVRFFLCPTLVIHLFSQTSAMLMHKINFVGVDFFCYANSFIRSNYFAWLLTTWLRLSFYVTLVLTALKKYALYWFASAGQRFCCISNRNKKLLWNGRGM